MEHKYKTVLLITAWTTILPVWALAYSVRYEVWATAILIFIVGFHVMAYLLLVAVPQWVFGSYFERNKAYSEFCWGYSLGLEYKLEDPLPTQLSFWSGQGFRAPSVLAGTGYAPALHHARMRSHFDNLWKTRS